MKLIIDIPDKVIAHIRSNYGHGVKCLYDEDKDIIIDAIYENRTLQAELEEIKSEMQDYGCSFIIAKRIDLAIAVSNCIKMVDKHIKGVDNEIL